MTTYATHTKAFVIMPAGEPIFSELATVVEIDDEASGPFVVIRQEGREGGGKVAIDAEEWPALRAAINRMVRVCERMN